MTVPSRRQSSVLEDVTSPWLALPTAVHVTLAWQYYCGKFPYRRVSYQINYREDKYGSVKSTIGGLITKGT